MVYDCFSFFNELDLLEMRLHILSEVVDKFVLVEATKTHAGEDKPLYFNENKERFAKFRDRIIHIIIDDYPPYETSWTYENYQRNCIIQGLKDAQPTDELIISDLDEIPDPEKVKECIGTPGIKLFEQMQICYFLNFRDLIYPTWPGTKILSYQTFLNSAQRAVDFSAFLLPAVNEGVTCSKIRAMRPDKTIRQAGWHFSYLGGVDAIIKKMKASSHQEYNNANFVNNDHIRHCLEVGNDILKRNSHYAAIEIDKSFPTYIRENQDKYKDLILHSKIKRLSWQHLKNIYYTINGRVRATLYFLLYFFTPKPFRRYLPKIRGLFQRFLKSRRSHTTS